MNDAPKTAAPDTKAPAESPEPKENIVVKPAPVTPTTVTVDKK